MQVIQTVLHWCACETPAALSIDLEREGEREGGERKGRQGRVRYGIVRGGKVSIGKGEENDRK